MLLAFDSPFEVGCTLIAAAVHESAHLFAFFLLGRSSSLPVPRLFGFRIYGKELLSYRSEIICYASGPLANLLAVAVAAPLAAISKEAYATFAVINLATGLCNLLPVKGYDGYKLIHTVLSSSLNREVYIRALDALSLLITALITFLTLYMIGRTGSGYWLFSVFFVSLLLEVASGVKNAESENNRDFGRF